MPNVTGNHFEKLMEGVDEPTRKQFEDCLAFFAADADTSSAAEKTRSDKLRTGYNNLVDFLVMNRMNELNPQQITFLCTGAMGDTITLQNPARTMELLPTDFYNSLIASFSKPNPDARSLPVYSVMEKFILIAKNEFLALTMGDERKKALRNAPQDQKRQKDDLKRRMDQVKSEINNSVNLIDQHFPRVLNSMNENAIKNAKVSLEMLKKVGAAWGRGDAASAQEKALLNAFENKVGTTGNSMAKWVDEIILNLGKVSENAKVIEEKNSSLNQLKIEFTKVSEASGGPVEIVGPLYNPVSISNLRTDIDTTNSVSVRVADSSPMKVSFSASRVLLNKHFGDNGNFQERLCSPENVIASLDKILLMHTNLFAKDNDGKFIIPAILIEPLRNFVDFFQDRFIMSLVSGEAERKGPFATFTPVDVQVLRMCALYLTKDPIYDYRGDVKVGTFMGDYVGKIEKQTKVKWTGQDKKFTLAATQSMQDTATRDDAIIDYIDFMSAMTNGSAPNPKLSKRKINILLKYVRFDKLEKNIAGILRLVAQQDPGEAKESIMHFAKDNLDTAKDLIRTAIASDPLTAKGYSNNPDFAIMRVFGMEPRKAG
jgi:hypothetical protein